MTVTTTGDLDAVKARQKAMWMAGDFGQIASFTKPTPRNSSSAAP